MKFHKRMKSVNYCAFVLQFSSRRGLALLIMLCLVLCLVLNISLRQWIIEDDVETVDPWEAFAVREAVEEEFTESGTAPGWLLVEETRAAIAAAGGVPNSSLSQERRAAWDEANPCAGRQHLLWLWTKQKRDPQIPNTTTAHQQGSKTSTLQQVLFHEYANLHRTCTHGGNMQYVTGLFSSGNESSTPCQFSVVEFGTHGVGNRLLWLISAFQHALLTRRVLLIDTRSSIHSLLCEPFPGSSWGLPPSFPFSSELKWPPPSEFQTAWDNWDNKALGIEKKSKTNAETLDKDGLRTLDVESIAKEKRDTMARIQAKIGSSANGGGLSTMDEEMTSQSVERKLMMTGEHGSRESSPLQQPHFHHVQANEGWAPHPRFFCDNEQERLHGVQWISFISGCLYFLPDLFAIPIFQPVLEDLFPNRDPVTHLLRQLTLPVDAIWIRVREVYIKEYSSASKVVGMQVRYRDGVGMYRNLNSLVNERISRCGLDHGLIPDPAASSGVNQTDGPVVIFIASLFPGLREHLEKEYRETLKKKRASLKLVQLSVYGFQAFDVQGDHQAFLEIICLSLVDELLTSPLSTYGQVAQGLAGFTPWLIDFQHHGAGESSTNCARGQSTDACFQFPISKFNCPFNKDVDGKEMAQVAPYLKPCQDLADGLQLVHL